MPNGLQMYNEGGGRREKAKRRISFLQKLCNVSRVQGRTDGLFLEGGSSFFHLRFSFVLLEQISTDLIKQCENKKKAKKFATADGAKTKRLPSKSLSL